MPAGRGPDRERPGLDGPRRCIGAADGRSSPIWYQRRRALQDLLRELPRKVGPVKGHGGTDMPVWGDAFKRSVEGYSEKAVKTRIEAIVEYVRTIQVK